MTGYHDNNRPAFRAAAVKVRAMGAEVISPDELDVSDPIQGEPTWENYLRRDIRHVSRATAGIALSGWRDSRGARLEIFIMKTLGIPVFELRGMRPIDDKEVATLTLPPSL